MDIQLNNIRAYRDHRPIVSNCRFLYAKRAAQLISYYSLNEATATAKIGGAY